MFFRVALVLALALAGCSTNKPENFAAEPSPEDENPNGTAEAKAACERFVLAYEQPQSEADTERLRGNNELRLEQAVALANEAAKKDRVRWTDLQVALKSVADNALADSEDEDFEMKFDLWQASFNASEEACEPLVDVSSLR